MLLYTQIQQKPQIQVQSPIQSDVESAESVHKQKERKVMILVSCLNPRTVSTVLLLFEYILTIRSVYNRFNVPLGTPAENFVDHDLFC